MHCAIQHSTIGREIELRVCICEHFNQVTVEKNGSDKKWDIELHSHSHTPSHTPTQQAQAIFAWKHKVR